MSFDSKMAEALEFVDDYRDARLDMALDLLEPPVRAPQSMMVPLAASFALASSGIMLAVIMVMGPGMDETGRFTNSSPALRQAVVPQITPVAAAVVDARPESGTAGFELSDSPGDVSNGVKPNGAGQETIIRGAPMATGQTIQSGSEN